MTGRPQAPSQPLPDVPTEDLREPSITAGAYLVSLLHSAGATTIPHESGQLHPLPKGLTDIRVSIPGIGIARISVEVESPSIT